MAAKLHTWPLAAQSISSRRFFPSQLPYTREINCSLPPPGPNVCHASRRSSLVCRGRSSGKPASAATLGGDAQLRADAADTAVSLDELEAALGGPLDRGPQAPAPKPLVVVISGPSGVGKDAVIKKLQRARRDLGFVVTATTRPRRPKEVDGVDYFFVSRRQFDAMIAREELLEYALVYGDYKGIPKRQVQEAVERGTDVVLRVDVQGAATVRSILGDEAVLIFLVAESEFALVRRLVGRKTEAHDKLLLRVATAREELRRMHEFDYVVTNAHGKLNEAVATLCAILDAERARTKQRDPRL